MPKTWSADQLAFIKTSNSQIELRLENAVAEPFQAYVGHHVRNIGSRIVMLQNHAYDFRVVNIGVDVEGRWDIIVQFSAKEYHNQLIFRRQLQEFFFWAFIHKQNLLFNTFGPLSAKKH